VWQLARGVVRNCIVAGAVVLAVAVAAGCGDDSESESNATEAPTRTAACEPQEVVIEAGEDGLPVLPTVASADDGALAEAIAASFCSPTYLETFVDGTQHTLSPRPVLDQQEALCIGDRIVDELGESRAHELWLRPGPWHLLGFALRNNRPPSMTERTPELEPKTIDRTEAETIAGVFEECSESWKLLFMLSVTEGTEGISDASAQCASDNLADEDARAILVGEIDRAYDDPSQPDAEPFADLVQPLIAVFEQCLTPSELGELDWN
jgi:hypothetical protein